MKHEAVAKEVVDVDFVSHAGDGRPGAGWPDDSRLGISARRLLVVFNPAAGRRRQRYLARVVAEATRLGASVTLRQTSARGDAEAMAREAALDEIGSREAALDETRSDKTDLVVVAAGGDGTANEVANGLAGSAVPLAIIPLGTANVLAQELGMPGSPEKVARALVFGKARQVWPGEFSWNGGNRRFLMMTGIGFDARVVEGVDDASKRRFGKLVYAREILREMLRARPFLAHVESAEGVFEAASVIFAKGHFYAGRFVLASDARLEEPSLQMVLFLKPGRLATLKCLAALGLGLIGRIPEVKIVATKAATITTCSGGPIEADGDLAGDLPATVRVASTPLWLVGPEV